MQSQIEPPAPNLAPVNYCGDAIRYGGGSRGDEPRRETRVRVKIEQRECANLQVHSYVLARGVSEVILYRSEFDHLQRELVRDDAERELIAQAKRDFEREITLEVVGVLRDRVEGWAAIADADIARAVAAGRDPDAIARDRPPGSQHDVVAARKSVLETTALSWPGCFSNANYGRGPKPIESATILEELGPPEQLNEVRIDAQAKAVGAEVARAMASAMSEQHASEIANLKAKIERLEQLIERKAGK